MFIHKSTAISFLIIYQSYGIVKWKEHSFFSSSLSFTSCITMDKLPNVPKLKQMYGYKYNDVQSSWDEH